MSNAPAERLRQLVTFRIDEDLFGFDIRIIKEVYPYTDFTAVPLAPDKIRGLINIRGQIVLVIEIAVLFDRPPRMITPSSQLVIIKTRQELEQMSDMGDRLPEGAWSDKPVAFVVDGIGDVLAIDGTEIDRVPPHIPEKIAAYLEGVVHVEDELLILLDAQQLL
jgi:purine-binding chemotaxis protein CheW